MNKQKNVVKSLKTYLNFHGLTKLHRLNSLTIVLYILLIEILL